MPLFLFHEFRNMLKGKKILIGITGSIAAYKMILLTRLLTKAGAEVRIVMTPAARDFVSPLTLSTLSGQPVLCEIAGQDTWANHVMLGRWADIMLVAPLSCNTLSKMAHGGCDNLLLAIYLSATCPIMVAPAMDEDMWHHPTTQKNLAILKESGHILLPVGNGELASGLHGEGRLAEPETILARLITFFEQQSALKGKKALITAGPTHEMIDPVRFIGNHSSGKMGQALALEMAARGAEVLLVCGPVSQSVTHKNITVINVVSAEEMYNAVIAGFPGTDVAIMAAAVADYTPVQTSPEKIKKSDDGLTITLTRTKDILRKLGEIKEKNQLLIGFALETNNGIEYAKKKLQSKNADLIILNTLQDAGAGFGYDTNKVTIFDKNGGETAIGLKSKQDVAREIVDAVIQYKHA